MSTRTTESVSPEEFEKLQERVELLERLVAALQREQEKQGIYTKRIAVSGPGPLGPGIGQPHYPWGNR